MKPPADTPPVTPPEKSCEIRCPRLGHQIHFSYCRSENRGLPCFKTLDCWHPYFDVHRFLKQTLTEEQFKKVFVKKGPPKILSLIEIIEQAQKDRESGGSTGD